MADLIWTNTIKNYLESYINWGTRVFTMANYDYEVTIEKLRSVCMVDFYFKFSQSNSYNEI